MKLYMTPTCPFVHRVLIAMKLRHIDSKLIESVEVDLSAPPMPLLDINPFGSVPTLELEPGIGFNESHVVMEFLDSFDAKGPRLFGNTPAAVAHTKAQIEAAANKLLSSVQLALYTFGNVNAIRRAETALSESWIWLESQLKKSKSDYLGGAQMNALDVSLAPFLVRLKWLFEKYPQLPKPIGKAAAYLERIAQHSAVASTLPDDAIVRSSLSRFLNPHPLLQAVIDAPRIVIDNPKERVSESGSELSFWNVEHDGKGFCMKAVFRFNSNSDAIQKLTWLHDSQETSDHHASVVMRDFQEAEITLVTHEPKWGISQKDVALARAIQTFFTRGKLP